MRTTQPTSILVLAIAALGLACGGKTETSDGSGIAAPDRTDVAAGATGTPAAPSAPAQPERVADDVGVPSAIALASDRVLFTTAKTNVNGDVVPAGGLFVVYKTLGRPLLVSLDAKGASYDALALDDTHAYVATSDARLFRVDLAGGAETPIAALPSPAAAIAVAGDHVYFAMDNGVVERVPKDGVGAVEAVATVAGAPRGVSVDEAGSVYVASAARAGQGGSIVKIAGGAKDPAVLTTSSASPCAMTRDGRDLFFTASGAVHRLPTGGGPDATIAAGFTACAITTDGTSLWLASGGVGLLRAPIAGGTAVPVTATAKALATPGTVAVDSTHLYWLEANAVLRLSTAKR